MGDAGHDRRAHGPLILRLHDQRDGLHRVRAAVAAALRAAALDELVDDAQLVASELVTNALLHAGTPARLIVHTVPPTARVEVHDPSPVPVTRPLDNPEGMAGRGLHLIEALGRDWGVEVDADGKCVWVLLEVGGADDREDLDEDELLAMWAPSADRIEPAASGSDRERHYPVRLGEVPVDLLLAVKEHVDDLVREFTLATTGARVADTDAVPPDLAKLLETVVTRFASARQSIRRQATEAAHTGHTHVSLQLWLPLEAADAGEQYLEALDKVDAYCRAARLLTLESPPPHRLFRRWYVGELIRQLRQAAAGESPTRSEAFEERLLREVDWLATEQRRLQRFTDLPAAITASSAARSPEEVGDAVLRHAVAGLDAAGGALALVEDGSVLRVPSHVGYHEDVVERLREQPPQAHLPVTVAARTGEGAWVESRTQRDERFPDLAFVEPGSVAVCAVPVALPDRRFGALGLSFAEARRFDRFEREFLQGLATLAAQALDRLELRGRAGHS